MFNNDRTYIIAEIGSNHEGDLARACALITMAAQAGADCVKFQHYRADTLASEVGFEQLGILAHYSDNPYRVFRRYEVPWEWTPILAQVCTHNGVDFMSTPYDLAAVDHLAPHVKAFKIGSGDITYHKLIKYAAAKGKPLLIATGASSLEDIDRIMKGAFTGGFLAAKDVCLMQCNTNYEVSASKSRFANLRVIEDFHIYWPAAVGYSDHTLDAVTALGAVALGARVIEKHFTDDRSRPAPDHPFAIEPKEWRQMVDQIRRLEAALGDGVKKVEANEQETVVLQRRCLRAATDLSAGHVITSADVVALRPAPEGSLPPYEINKLVGWELSMSIRKGEYFE